MTITEQCIMANSNAMEAIGEYIIRGFLTIPENDPDCLGRAITYLLICNEELKNK